MIQTASGSVRADELGVTLMHEHLCVTWPAMRLAYPERYDRDAIFEIVVGRLAAARAAGIQTIVDATPPGLGRDVDLIRSASAESGVTILLVTGFYVDIPYYYRFRPTEAIVGDLVREIEVGISTSGVRTALIKCSAEDKLDRLGQRIHRACARAHVQTGCPIYTHSPVTGQIALEQLSTFEEEGVDPRFVAIGHAGDSDDVDYLEQLLSRGCYLGLDRFGLPESLSTEVRVRTLVSLINRGWIDRLLLSHDAPAFWDQSQPDTARSIFSSWNFDQIPSVVVPMLAAAGISKSDIDAMLIENPRRFLAGSSSGLALSVARKKEQR